MNERKSFQNQKNIADNKNMNCSNEKIFYQQYSNKKLEKICITNVNNLNNKAGITLIALVISIIVMLILAGVSLNATIGDNGIITQAQNATYMQSVAVLEEFFQQKYVDLYLDNNSKFTKLDIVRKNYSDWFYKPTKTGLSYILLDGNIYYLIEKENLPSEIKNQIKGGDAGNKTYQDYANFKDVYGITSDLKVYYCSNGVNERIGASDEKLEDSATREAISNTSTSGLGKYLIDNFDWIKTDAKGNVLVDGMASLKEFTIDSSNISNLEELYNFSSLQKLYLKNVNLRSLQGVETCPKLQYVYIYNSTIDNYVNLSDVSNLNYLYLEQINNLELEKLSNSLKESSISNLQYFGIYNSDITTLEYIESFNKNLKEKILYLDIHNTLIKNLKGLNSFENLLSFNCYSNNDLITLEGLHAPNLLYFNNRLTDRSNINLVDISSLNISTKLKYFSLSNSPIYTLDALKNANDIETIYANSCQLGKKYDNDKNSNNALNALENKILLRYLNVENNPNLVYCDYLINDTNIRNLYLKDCNNIKGSELALLKSIIKLCGNNYTLPTNLGLLMLDNDTIKLDLSNQEISVNNFETLKGNLAIKYLSLKDISLKKQDGEELNGSEYNQKINEVVSTLINLEVVQLDGITGLNEITFVKNCNKLTEIDLRNTSVTTENDNGLMLLNIYALNLKTLVINNSKVDLSLIQSTISRMDRIGSVVGSFAKNLLDVPVYGIVCENQEALKTLIKCTEITNFVVGPHFKYSINLSNCSKINNIYIYFTSGGSAILPNEGKYIAHCIDVYNDCISGGKGCTKFYVTHPYTTSSDEFWKLLSGFENSDNLESVYFGFTSTTSATYIKSTGLEVFNNCKNLKEIEWDGRNVTPYIGNCDNLNCLSNIESLEKIKFNYITASTLPNLSKLTKLQELNINTSLLMDINGLRGVTSLKNLQLYNNSIGDLSAIGTLVNLEELNLQNNSITNSITTIANGFVDNVNVLNNLKNNYGKLKKLYISGNSFNDVSKLDWAITK